MKTTALNRSVMTAACLTIGIAGITGVYPRPAQAALQPAVKKGTLQAAVFAKGLTKNQEPVNPTGTFFPDDTACLSLKFKGRPSKGLVSAKFYLGAHLISEAKVDFADINRGVLFSVGQSTFAGFSLQPDKPFPISENYHVETFLNGSPLGTYRFKVVPPAGSLTSKFTKVTLAKGVNEQRLPVGPAKTFTAAQSVYIAVTGDLGAGSSVAVNWYTGGKVDDTGTKNITASKNIPNTNFYFAFRPVGGWKPGKQEVVLLLNDKEAGRYAFTIK
jgi:hypothetical protein